jgi:Spy/CpxP family protein refolding chaperone
MLPLIWILATATAVAQQGLHDHHRSHYAGLESRELKALSNEEIQGLQAGEGMSLALVAELNHHPGPKHALELQRELALSLKQAQKAQEIFDRMHREAVRLGSAILEKERELESLFRSAEVNDTTEAHVVGLGRLRGELRWAHLKAHLEMRDVLTEEQRQHYDALRGYAADTSAESSARNNGSGKRNAISSKR